MSDNQKSALGGVFGKDSQTSYDVYLNLTPLMDVMSNILFFLLSAFGASAVAIFSVSVPIDASSEANSNDPPEDKVVVTMRVEQTGITLGCQDPVKTPDELKICTQRIGKRGNDYDTQALSTALVAIRNHFKGSNTIMMVPDDELHYDTIVKILDAARDVKQPDGKKLPLFPEVVMSSLVK